MGDDFRLDVCLLFVGRREADLLMDAVNTEECDVKNRSSSWRSVRLPVTASVVQRIVPPNKIVCVKLRLSFAICGKPIVTTVMFFART